MPSLDTTEQHSQKHLHLFFTTHFTSTPPSPCSRCIHAVACGAAFRSLPFSGSVKRTKTAQGVAEAKPLTRHSTSAEHRKPPVHHLAGFRDKHGWHSTGEKQHSVSGCDSSLCLSGCACHCLSSFSLHYFTLV